MPEPQVSHKNTLRFHPLYPLIKEDLETYFTKIRPFFVDKHLSRSEGRKLAFLSFTLLKNLVNKIQSDPGEKRELFVLLALATWEDMGRPLQIVPDFKFVPDLLEKQFEDKIIDPLVATVIEFSVGVMYDYLMDPTDEHQRAAAQHARARLSSNPGSHRSHED